MKKVVILGIVLSALMTALPVSADSEIPYANYGFHHLGEGYFDYGSQNDWSDDGWSFVNLTDRTWLSTKPSWPWNKDGPKIPLSQGFEKMIAYAINDAEQVIGYTEHFSDSAYPPTFPFVWDPPAGNLQDYPDQEAGTTTILAGVEDYKAVFPQRAGNRLRYFYPKDISNDGSLVVGCAQYSSDSAGESTAWLWDEPNLFLTLPVDEGFSRPCAFLIIEAEDDGFGPAIYGVAEKNGGWHKVKWTPLAFIEVDIDIKPGNDSNPINPGSKGAIPVAILGSADLDVTHINPDTLRLDGLAVKAGGKSNKLLAHYKHVNTDGYIDLLVQIDGSDGAFANGTATLTGNLYLDHGGTRIQGTDDIRIVP